MTNIFYPNLRFSIILLRNVTMQICDNHGKCSCNVGFTGTLCQWVYNKHPRQKRQIQLQPCIDPDTCLLDANGGSCVDVNECALGIHNCEQLCINTQASYRCSCRSGYSLSSNGRSCSGKLIQNEKATLL